MPSQADRQLGQLAVKLGVVSVAKVNECLRIQAAQEELGEPTSLDRVLFDQGLLTGPNVYQLQSQLKLRIAFCPHCDTKYNLFSAKPGSIVQCKKCGGRVPVPGYDPSNPFLTPAVGAGVAPHPGAVAEARRTRAASGGQPAAGDPARPRGGWGTFLLGLLAWLAVGTVLGEASYSSLQARTALWMPAAIATGAFLVLSIPVRRGGQFVVASSLGLAAFTGLVAWAALTEAPGDTAYASFGIGAHDLIAPLVLVYLTLIFVAGWAFLRVTPAWLVWIPFMPAIYGFLFFIYRLFPIADPAEYFSGPSFLDSIPWYAHPGTVTLVLFFPLAAAFLLVSSVFRLLFKRPRTFFRALGVVAGSLALAAFGLAVGRTRAELPMDRVPAVEREVDRALDRIPVAPWWKPAPAEEPTPAESTETPPAE